MKDFRYYRCSGTDPYRFGGERICSNSQIQAEKIEAVWKYVREAVKNPGKLEETLSGEGSVQHKGLPKDVDALKNATPEVTTRD